MNSAYDDNYWNDQGNGGVAGQGNAYAGSGNANPEWANEPDYNDPKYNNNDWQKDKDAEQPKPKPKTKVKTKKKSRRGGKTDDVTIDKKSRECCNPRCKRYMGLWTFFLLCMAIGIVLMVIAIIIPGLIIFLVGLAGIFCSGYCFKKCS